MQKLNIWHRVFYFLSKRKKQGNGELEQIGVRNKTFQEYLRESHGVNPESTGTHHSLYLPYTQCKPANTKKKSQTLEKHNIENQNQKRKMKPHIAGSHC